MNKVELGYYTLKDAAERWDCTEYTILEWGANGLLKIHLAYKKLHFDVTYLHLYAFFSYYLLIFT